ncbi:hypothetical protein CDAR_499921 [Caerostris darwini]|uniref:Uncharacterized protein n=1 Tax=Caerostris darwini TaxID=1538125 RepID=A0AAV4VD78_9ARAC|nr:hypothetical protein CDAR_499921 [Caerostris darwini]
MSNGHVLYLFRLDLELNEEIENYIRHLKRDFENDESDIDDDDYDDLFVNPAPAETVINKLNINIDAGMALAPGEDQMPLSVLSDNFAEELSYLRIYCGDMRRFTRKKTSHLLRDC